MTHEDALLIRDAIDVGFLKLGLTLIGCMISVVAALWRLKK